MGKKSLDRKAAQKFIVDSRDNGKTDQEIYNDLAQQYYDKKSLALLITGTATTAAMNKYKNYNMVLVVFLAISFAFRLYLIILYGFSFQSFDFLPLMLLFFMFGIASYNAGVYKFCGLIAIIGFLYIVFDNSSTLSIIINLIFALVVGGLSFYLPGKLFPKFNPKNLKKDSNGEYILS